MTGDSATSDSSTADSATAQAVLDRMGWAVDRRDWAGVEAVLADSVELDYTELFGGRPARQTGRQVADQWRATLGALDGTQHVITGARAVARDDGSLLVTANVVGAHVRADRGARSPWVVGGWYEAVLEPGTRRVSSLTLHPVWQTGDRGVLDG